MEPKPTPLHPDARAEPSVPAEAPTIILGDADAGDAAAAGMAAEPGRPVVSLGDVLGGRFHLVELIGEGGMSRVYKAIDSQRTAGESADIYVAVKVLSRPFSDDEASFALLQGEIQKLQTLAHPNIVRLYSCARQESTVFISMEYLVGRSLYARLHSLHAGGPLPSIDRNDAQTIIAAVAGALEYAHQNLIVHGDLKPGNVIITEVGEIKVIDFGVAGWSSRPQTALERRESAQRQPPSAVTPRYASPQLMARQKPEPTDDIYALACLAYELMTGTHPFGDGGGTQPLTFPPPLRSGLTPPQYAAITRGLQLDKRSRTPTVRQFMDEFAAAPRRRPWKFRIIVILAALLAVAGGLYWRAHPGATSSANLPAAQPPTIPPPTTQSPVLLPPASAPAQAVAAAPPPGTIIRDCPTCPQMTVLPTGSFQQGFDGSAAATPNEKPRHRVAIAYFLAMANRDVTVGDFSEFIAATGRDMQGCDVYDGAWRYKRTSSWKNPGFTQSDVHPVTCTSWDDAVAYAGWLSARTGHHYRLPSASEWEYAARAGSEAERPWGAAAKAACENGNVADRSAAHRYPGWAVFACDDGYVNTAPVSTFKANAFGLDDMLGNVFQWTLDCWQPDYSDAPADGAPRRDGNCGERELRGGSWFSAPAYVRPAYRNHFAADYRTSSVGFRLVREATP